MKRFIQYARTVLSNLHVHIWKEIRRRPEGYVEPNSPEVYGTVFYECVRCKKRKAEHRTW